MNEMKHPLPWDTVGCGVFSGDNLIADAEDDTNAQQIADAANALTPLLMRWRTVAQYGPPNRVGWYICTIPDHGFPVIRHADVPDDVKNIIAWMPVPDAPVPTLDPFDEWWTNNFSATSTERERLSARAAWEAALKSKL